MTEKPVIDRYCPKCCSNRVYIDDDFYACRECGNRRIPTRKAQEAKAHVKTLDDVSAVYADTFHAAFVIGIIDTAVIIKEAAVFPPPRLFYIVELIQVSTSIAERSGSFLSPELIRVAKPQYSSRHRIFSGTEFWN